MHKNSKIYVAGHTGLVGSALLRKLKEQGYSNIITRTRAELDLTKGKEVRAFFFDQEIDYVFLVAGKVGGIVANQSQPYSFLYDNLMIASNVIDAANDSNVGKLLFLGSSCIYPKLAKQPIEESDLLTGPLETTNEMYAVAKIAGVKLCQSVQKQYGRPFISAMPTNLYGPGDSFHPDYSHVIPGMISRFHWAKVQSKPWVDLWGTGSPYREFMYVDDLAEACIIVMQKYTGYEPINIGTGKDIMICDLARTIAQVIGYKGQRNWDLHKPDGTPRKLLDISKLNALGFVAKTSLEQGLRATYDWYLKNKSCG